MDIYGPNGMYNRTPKNLFEKKKLDYIIAIALIRGATFLKYKFLSEFGFGMIF